MSEKISVIVPVYNVESYLEKCVHSICSQTYENLEIILVDDGSTDSSGKICDEISCRDKRVKVYHKVNGGLVSARKYGVEKATGMYLSFVDGDDWIELNMYAKMMGHISRNTNMQLVTSGLRYEWENKFEDIYDGLTEGDYCGKDKICDILYNLTCDRKSWRQKILTSVCNKLFVTEIMKCAVLDMDDTVTLGEDGVLLCNYISMIENICVMNYVGYHYVQHTDSMIHKNSYESFVKIYNLKKCFEECMERRGIRELMQGQIDYYVKGFLGNVINDIYDIRIINPVYIFPFDDLPFGTRIVLYGAGVVGDSYWNYIIQTKHLNLVKCVDKNYKEKQKYGKNVHSIITLKDEVFDYIIIAVEQEQTAKEIKKEILSVGIEEDRILWRKPTGKIL